MRKYQEIKGDLIQLALSGEFDVIAHGCNCFNIQKAGIAAQMSKHFNTDDFSLYVMENPSNRASFWKLGNIDWSTFIKFDKNISEYIQLPKDKAKQLFPNEEYLHVVNCYTQYELGKHLNYHALKLCLQKINWEFKDKHIGLPQIGCGIAGGIWEIVGEMIQHTLKDCNVTVVIYEKE